MKKTPDHRCIIEKYGGRAAEKGAENRPQESGLPKSIQLHDLRRMHASQGVHPRMALRTPADVRTIEKLQEFSHGAPLSRTSGIRCTHEPADMQEILCFSAV